MVLKEEKIVMPYAKCRWDLIFYIFVLPLKTTDFIFGSLDVY